MEPNARFTNSENLTRLSEQVLDAAKNELFLAMRFFFTPLNTLTYKREQRIHPAGSDGSFFYYNPLSVCRLYRSHPVLVNRLFLHSVLHCLFRHMYQCGERNAELWNFACDAAVESIIDTMDYQCTARLIPHEREVFYRDCGHSCQVLCASAVYTYLESLPENRREALLAARPFFADDHSFWGQGKTDSPDEESPSPQKEQEKSWLELSRKTQTQLSSYSPHPGTKESSLLQMLCVENTRRISYREFLKKFAVLRETLSVDMDAFDYGYYCYGLSLYKNMPLIEEPEYKEEHRIEDFAIVLDTSGSCSGPLIRQFVEETFSILSETESFFRKIRLHIIQCDNTVQQDICLTDLEACRKYMDNFEIHGFGGTDFRPAFSYIRQLCTNGVLLHLRGILYFTDGCGIYPQARPPFETVFVFPDAAFRPQVPAWAMQINYEANSRKAAPCF